MADAILGIPRLPAAEVAIALPLEWETQQRAGTPARAL